MNHVKKYLLLFAMITANWQWQTQTCFSQDVSYKAYTVFLYNFMKYIEWPDNSGDFVIGVYGNSPVNTELIKLAATKKNKGRNIIVKLLVSAEDILQCNMIYLPSSQTSIFKVIAAKSKGKPILIVGERDGLAKKGAAISFVVDDDDILKFDINKSVLDAQNLKIANVLIQLGILVN